MKLIVEFAGKLFAIRTHRNKVAIADTRCVAFSGAVTANKNKISAGATSAFSTRFAGHFPDHPCDFTVDFPDRMLESASALLVFYHRFLVFWIVFDDLFDYRRAFGRICGAGHALYELFHCRIGKNGRTAEQAQKKAQQSTSAQKRHGGSSNNVISYQNTGRRQQNKQSMPIINALPPKVNQQ